MERSRVEDIKKKFECLQNQSTAKNYVSKSQTDLSSSKPVLGRSSLTENQNIRLPTTNTSNFVGRGNIKRSHAFRADKPVSRNFLSVGNDIQHDITEALSSDLCVQRLSSDNVGANSKFNYEIKSKRVLNDSRQAKYSISKKNDNINSVNSSRSLSSNSPILSLTSPVSEIQNLDNTNAIDKETKTIKSVSSLKKSPVDLYSTVFKSRRTPDLLSSVCDNLDLSDKSANSHIATDSSLTLPDVSSVNSFINSIEQQSSLKKISNERLKARNTSPKNSKTDDHLTNTLKAALSAPLPSGPPPKKPPRTFAHKPISLNNTPNDKDFKKQSVLKTNSASSVKQTENDCMLFHKPMRSKTESQIMLKKLENYLLNHQQNVLEASSNVNFNKSLKKQKSTRANEMNINKTVIDSDSIQQLPFRGDIETSAKINSRFISSLINSNISNPQANNSANDNSCFHSLNCTKQPIYESPVMKKSNFFITIPRHSSVDDGKSESTGNCVSEFQKSSYGLIKRSASDEHIYAEPETIMNSFSNNGNKKSLKLKSATMSDRGKSSSSLRSALVLPVSSSPSEISKRGDVQSLRMNFERPSCLKDTVDGDQNALQSGLHYMCSPINDSSSPGFNDSVELPTKVSDEFDNKKLKKGNIVNDCNKVVNEAINSNVRLNVSPLHTSKSNLSSDQLSQLSLISDCSRPRQIRMTSTTDQTVPEIDRQRIHQLVSEAYGKIKHNNFDRSAVIPGGSGEIASSSDSDCSSVISSPDDPLHPTFLSQPLSTAVDSVPAVVSNLAGGMPLKSSKDREQMTAERIGYVRRVSRRLTSVRRSPHLTPDRFNHLFECLLLVGLDLNSARCKVPYIKTKFPENVSSPPGIANLCFPDADDWPPSPDSGQSYIQILTDSNGIRKYSYCRRVQPEDAVICLPLVYCIITSFKSNAFYNKILIDLESRHGHQSDSELLKFIEQLYDCPFPAPGQILSFQQQINSESMVDIYKRPLDSRQEDNELIQLLTTIKLSRFLQIFATLLHERKVILISDSISKLSVCIEGLQSALYPFYWQHTIVPILPSVIMDVCEAPTPYLIGIIKPKLSDIPFSNVDLDLVVDIDDDLILNSKGDEAWILPSRLSRGLRSALQLSVQTSQTDINTANVLANEAIMRLFVELIGNYRDHISLVSNDSKKREFQRETFIRSNPSRSVQLFLEWFTETAMFYAFMESRLERTIESRGLFEQRCSEYNEENENGHSLMKNYKALNKTVKTLGDRFKAALS